MPQTGYTMTPSATGGPAGSPFTLTFAPTGGDGTWLPRATITLTQTGASATLANGTGGTLAGNVLTVPAGTSTPCTVTVTPSGSVSFAADFAWSLVDPPPLDVTFYPAITSATRLMVFDANLPGKVLVQATAQTSDGQSYNTDAPATANGQFVMEWDDALGAGGRLFTIFQTATYVTNSQNGKAGISSQNDLLGSGSATWPASMDTAFTIAIVAKIVGAGSNSVLCQLGSGPTGLSVIDNNNGTQTATLTTGSGSATQSSAVAVGTLIKAIFRWDGAHFDAFVNSTTKNASQAISGAITVDKLFLANSHTLTGVAPLTVYYGDFFEGAASDEDCATLMTGMTALWGS